MKQTIQKPKRVARPRRSKVYRFDARLNADQKKLIQRAADLEGRSMTDFVLESAQQAAQRTIETRAMLMATIRESEDFAKSILNPPAPGMVLRRALHEYRKAMGRK